MTPFGERVRRMRRERGVSQKEMAAALGVTPSYLSALEHGRRGAPPWGTVQKIIGFFNVIWDDAEELEALALLSNPRVVVDTAGLSPLATRTANLFAERVGTMDEARLAGICALLEAAEEELRTAPSGRPAGR